MREARSPLTLQQMTSNEEIGYTWGDVFNRGKNIIKLGCVVYSRATASTFKGPSEFHTITQKLRVNADTLISRAVTKTDSWK